MFLPAPTFFGTCLNLNLEKTGRVQIARVVNRGEPCVRKWHRDNKFPPEAVDKLIAYVGTIGNGKLKDEIEGAMKEPFRAITDAHRWQMICHGILANEDALLPNTFGAILLHSSQWLDAISSIRKLEKTRRLDSFKDQLLSVEGPKFYLPVHLHRQIAESRDWEGLRPAMAWLFVENFIYYLAMAEVEYLWLYHRISGPKISRIVLPRLQRDKIQYPIKLFFEHFFNNLVSKGPYSSSKDIWGEMPRVLPLDKKGKESGKSRSKLVRDSGEREFKRAKYEGKAPAFETFRAWIDALIPADFYPSREDREIEKQFLCDVLGAARIIEKFFREVSKDIPEKELLARFENYDVWHRIHSSAIIGDSKEGPGVSQALLGVVAPSLRRRVGPPSLRDARHTL